MLTLYDYLPSQNAWKVRALLSQLGLPYRTEHVSIFAGEGQRPEYLAVNPTGAVPALELADGRVLAESGAILTFLADGTPWLPDERFERARVLQWLSFENDYLQNSIGSLRYWTLTAKIARRSPELVAGKRATAMRVLHALDRELAARDFLVGTYATIADIACFAYTHLAEDGDLPLADFAHVMAWLERVQDALPGLPPVHPYAIDPHSAGELP